MSEIKYVVPQPIKDAVHNALASYPVAANTGHAAEIACESFAKALRENPIVPTKEQAVDLGVSVAGETVSERYALLVSEWQRRMFIVPEPESATNSRPLPRNHDDGRGRYKCPECGHILEPGGSFQSDCRSCVSIAYRIYLAKVYTAEHNGEPIPTPPRWTFLYRKSKPHGGSSIFDQGEDSLCAIKLKDEMPEPEMPEPEMPEPEVPEAIKDLISEYATDSSNKDALVRAMARGHNADVIEAYRRGQQSKEGAK